MASKDVVFEFLLYIIFIYIYILVKLFSLKSPDEWATTKQACRDTYVVTCFLPSTIRILALLYVLSTVLRISSSNLLYIYIYIYIYNLTVEI